MSGYALPRSGEVFFDARGDDRVLRLSWHPDAGVVVLSVWNRETCAATFRLPAEELAGFVRALSRMPPEAAAPYDPGPATVPDLLPEGGEHVPMTGQHHPR